MPNMRVVLVLVIVALISGAPFIHAAAPPTTAPFRTDATTDPALRWYQLKPAEFPPANSAHHIGGELISIDHVNRSGALRRDRDDTQRPDGKDRPVPFAMLAYGSIVYHGAPAELRDVPIGTHLHGQFYVEEKAAKEKTDERAKFDRVVRLEDDFSFMARQGRAWRVDAVDVDKGKLTVTGVAAADGSGADAKPTVFQIVPATRVWKGRGAGTLKDLAAGQTVQVNLTVATLKGPGRVTDVWVDQESRDLAAQQQVEVHRQYQREHGLAAIVDSVDNKAGVVVATLFDGFDPKLAEPFKVKSSLSAAVAEENLRTYDQINDTMNGPILDVRTTPARGLGDSGIRVTFKPNTLIEGYRPRRIVRLFWGGWRVDDLPLEERLYQ